MKLEYLIWMSVALALSAAIQRRIKNPFAAEVVFMWVFCGWPILVITILILLGYIRFELKLIFSDVPSP